MKCSKAKTRGELAILLDQFAIDLVDHWIEDGLTTGDMRDKRANVLAQLDDALIVYTRYFAETGKYPSLRNN